MLKNKKGITLISLIIYVTALTLLISVVANISRSFYKNINEFSDTNSIEIQVQKFNTFFLKQINTSSILVNEASASQVSFSDGTYYIYNPDEKAVYCSATDKNIKICSGIEELIFVYDEENQTIELTITDGKNEKMFKYKKK